MDQSVNIYFDAVGQVNLIWTLQTLKIENDFKNTNMVLIVDYFPVNILKADFWTYYKVQ